MKRFRVRSIDRDRTGRQRMSARATGRSVTSRTLRKRVSDRSTPIGRSTPRLERGHVPPRATRHIQHLPAWSPVQRATEKVHQTLGVGFVAVRIEVKVFLPEPFFEPFGHRTPLIGRGRLTSFVIRFAPQDRKRAIELLQHHDPGQLVRQSQRTEAPAECRSLADVIRQTGGAARSEKRECAATRPSASTGGRVLRW